jgi:hypothetical protein
MIMAVPPARRKTVLSDKKQVGKKMKNTLFDLVKERYCLNFKKICLHLILVFLLK